MNPTAIYSKSGKGVQEAAGKTSLLQRPDRAVLSAIDGRATLADVAQKVGKSFDAAFQALITKLDKDGFVREVSSGAAAPQPAAPKPAAAAPKPAAKPAAKAASGGGGDDLDFSSFSTPPPPPKPAAAPPKPAAKAAPASADALDFSSLTAPPKPAAAAPQPQQSALNKAREEAEAKAQAERDRVKKEAEAKMRAEMEAQMRAEAEKKQKEDSESKAAADAKTKAAAAAAEAQVKAAKEAALKSAEAKVKIEREAKAKIEEERKAREEMEKRLDAERKAREDTERKSKEEADRVRKELEAERKAREEAERKGKEEAERARKELEEERKRIEAERKKEDEERAARRKREEEEAAARRKQKEEEEHKAEEERAAKRKQREEEEHKAEEERAAKRKQREAEESAREREEEEKREAERAAKKKQREEEEAAREAAEEAERSGARKKREEERLKAEADEEAAQAAAAATAKAAAKAAPKAAPPKPAAKKDDFSDSLLADLDNFQNKEEEELKARAEAEAKAKAEAERQAREAAERQAKEEAERKRREEEEQRRKDEEARRDREEEERRAQEEERRKREADEIRKKAEAATAAAMAKEGKKAPAKAGGDDIPLDDDDLDMDEVKREAAAIAKGKPKEKPEKEKKRKKERIEAEEPLPKVRRPSKLGKPIALGLFFLLVVAVGVLHVMPLNTADYERVATEALGRPVKIGSANLWLLTGVQVRFSNVTVGDAKIAHVNAHTAPGSVFGEKKEFSKIELDGLTLPQQAIGDAIFATLKSERFSVDEIFVKNLEVPGPATLPKSLQADASLDAKGRLKSATVRGPDGLVAKIAVQDDGISFEATAAGFIVPIVPQMTLSNFSMKGSATPRGMSIAQWGGSVFGGAMTGTANVRWGGNWNVDGVLTVRGVNAAVFAPALLSAGNAEGTGKFSMSATDPSGLAAAGRLDGNFTVSNGTLGSFDLAGAIQSGGKNYRGSTQFVELTGQGSYDRGAIALRNINIGAGALNAGATADIAQNGALSGRIVADVRTTQRALSATLLLGGSVKEPQVRN